MVQSFVKLNKGLLKIHPFWVVFVQLLILLNGILPAIFWRQLEARVVLFSFALSTITMTALTYRFGFARILGLAHAWWLPMMIYLPTRWSIHPADTPFGIWLRVIVIIDIIALLFDANDVRRWLNGERDEMVANL